MSTETSNEGPWQITFPMKVETFKDNDETSFGISHEFDYDKGHTINPYIREYAEKKMVEYKQHCAEQKTEGSKKKMTVQEREDFKKKTAFIEKGWAVNKGAGLGALGSKREDHWQTIPTKDGWLTKNCKLHNL